MGKVDAEAKAYLSNVHRFADLFNYFAYGGKSVINPGDLTPADTTELAIIHGNGAREAKQLYRDVLKLWGTMSDGQKTYSVMGVENQMHVHYAMPVRCMMYDAMRYGSQVSDAQKARRTARTEDAGTNGAKETSGEFLSGFGRDDKIAPVVTVVLYLAPDPWDGPKSVAQMFGGSDAAMSQFAADYRMNLIEPASMSAEDFDLFATDLGPALKYIKYSKNREELGKMVLDDNRFMSIDAETASFINAISAGSPFSTVQPKSFSQRFLSSRMPNSCIRNR